jgi:hypothetical protein
MEKKCTICNEVKNFDEFYNRKAAKDGKQSTCKFCMKKAQFEFVKNKPKILIPEDKKGNLKNKTLVLSGIKKEDYCEMYCAMGKLGYNPANTQKSIHVQFCEKWSLNVSKRPRKGKPNQYTYQDCQDYEQ